MSEKNVQTAEEQKTGGVVVEVYEWLESISFALAVVVIIFTFIFRVVSVSGESMQPTLTTGDRVIVNSFLFTPKNGDIVVTTQPNSHDNDPLIKRVIAVEGQTISIDTENDTVTVDGVVLNENYILEEDIESAGDAYEYPLTIPKGKVFVMGDNRNGSFDSRRKGLGLVDKDYIMGKVIFRIYPFEKVGGLS